MANGRLRDFLGSCQSHASKHRRLKPFLRLLGLVDLPVALKDLEWRIDVVA
jgi:hypothetical protein